MNIFVLDTCPIKAAKMHCDKHIVKMPTEAYQMLGSAARRHGATDDMMPLTKSGTPLLGGYHNHPCTKWAGDTRDNYIWLCHHAAALAEEYEKRYDREHFVADPIEQLYTLAHLIPEKYMADSEGYLYSGVGLPIERKGMSPFALAMPDEFRPIDLILDPVNNVVRIKQSHATANDAVQAYRDYYLTDKARIATWDKGRPAPDWWL